MVKLKTYTPEERAERRQRTSISIINDRPLPNAMAAIDFDESWVKDLLNQGVDIEEFLKDVAEPSSIDNNDRDVSSEVSSITRRIRELSKQQQEKIIHNISLSSNSETAKQRFSTIFGQTYEYDSVTGAQVVLSIEDIEKRKWEAEVEEDSRYFDPTGTSEEVRKRNEQWAIDRARQHVINAGFGPKVEDKDDAVNGIHPYEDIETELPEPPPYEPLPFVEDLNLGTAPKRTIGPRNIGIFPPPLPHKLTDVIPKLSRHKFNGIPTGIVVGGSLNDGWASCDSTTMMIMCINKRTEKCGSYLRCPRSASLVRCPRCHSLSPATCLPVPIGAAADIKGNN